MLTLCPPLWQDPVYGNKKDTGCALKELVEQGRKKV